MAPWLAFLISSLRAMLEVFGLCLLGQGALHVLAGSRRQSNAIYQLFSLTTRAPRRWIACCLPAGTGEGWVASLSFGLVFCLWLGLAALRRWLMLEATPPFSAIIPPLPSIQALT